MKTPFTLMLFAAAAFSACGDTKSKDEIQAFIPGTYTRSSEHEYGKEYDTISLSVQNEVAREFKVVRKWRYERVLDGKPIEPEYKNTIGAAIYDPTHKLLKETKSGDTYSFDAQEKVMFAGSTKYVKSN